MKEKKMAKIQVNILDMLTNLGEGLMSKPKRVLTRIRQELLMKSALKGIAHLL